MGEAVNDERVSDDAIERLYREDGMRLWRAILAYCRDPEVANDATAEAFAGAISDRGRIRDPKAWVWKVAFRVADDELAHKRRTIPLPQDGHYEMDDPDVMTTLAVLPDRQRATIILHYYGDLTTREIARILGCSQATVGVHLHRGRNKLRELLGDDDG